MNTDVKKGIDDHTVVAAISVTALVLITFKVFTPSAAVIGIPKVS